jgi:hypothetical protein
MPQDGQKTIAEIYKKRTWANFTLLVMENSSPFMYAEENHCNSRYLTDLPGSDVDRNMQVCPFSKAPAAVMILGRYEE